ncbi:cytochrome P450 [Kitasatospora sp. NPDC093102]|uniref:cytochrome P450 family protein n=1 Tax=Kitasatospora sp. NPDC093102 TaxID=3155069 RepID=UPI003444AB41
MDSPQHPPIPLDAHATDRRRENLRLGTAGPLVRAELPGGVPCWAVTRHEEARALLTDPRLVKDMAHWGALRRGELPEDWPLGRTLRRNPSMATVDGPEHTRLRTLTARALTPRRVELLRPRIEQIADRLLTALAEGPEEVVDLKAAFAFPLPMTVISELLGFDPERYGALRELYELMFTTLGRPEQLPAAAAELQGMLVRLVADKHDSPGDDLTSALIAATEDGLRLTDAEIVGTLDVLIAAGHETAVNLITSAVRALLTHPDQRRLVLDGVRGWSDVVEETLRWAAPVSHIPFRFATEDVRVGEEVIGAGEMLVVSYGAIGLDPERHGPGAERFDLTRTPAARHLSFGHGPHVCPGAQLGRLEAEIALSALFTRFPRLAPVVAEDELRPKPSLILDGVLGLPVRLDG